MAAEFNLRVKLDAKAAKKAAKELKEELGGISTAAEKARVKLGQSTKVAETAFSKLVKLVKSPALVAGFAGAAAAAGLGVLVRRLVDLGDAYRGLQQKIRPYVRDTNNLAAVNSELLDISEKGRLSYVKTVGIYKQLSENAAKFQLSQKGVLEVTRQLAREGFEGTTVTQRDVERARKGDQGLEKVRTIEQAVQSLNDKISQTIGRAVESTGVIDTVVGLIERITDKTDEVVDFGAALFGSLSDGFSTFQDNWSRGWDYLEEVTGGSFNAIDGGFNELLLRFAVATDSLIAIIGTAIENAVAIWQEGVKAAQAVLEPETTQDRVFASAAPVAYAGYKFITGLGKRVSTRVEEQGLGGLLSNNEISPATDAYLANRSAGELIRVKREAAERKGALGTTVPPKEEETDTKAQRRKLTADEVIRQLTREQELLKLGNRERQNQVQLETILLRLVRAGSEFDLGDVAKIDALIRENQVGAEAARILEMFNGEADKTELLIEGLNEALAQQPDLLNQNTEAWENLAIQIRRASGDEAGANLLQTIQNLEERIGNTRDMFLNLAVDGVGAVTNAFQEALSGGTDFVTGLRNGLASLLSDLAASILRLQLLKGVARAFNIDLNVLPGRAEGKAEGGPVAANRPYIVGEKGPEFFVPAKDGTIVPNDQIGGSTNVTVINQTNPEEFGNEIDSGDNDQKVLNMIARRPRAFRAALNLGR